MDWCVVCLNANWCTALFPRLFSHQDDPDIDEPYQAPVGSKLGAGKSVFDFVMTIESIFILNEG